MYFTIFVSLIYFNQLHLKLNIRYYYAHDDILLHT